VSKSYSIKRRNKMSTDFSFTDNMLDVRDLIEKFEELETIKEEKLEDVPVSEYGNDENKLWKEWEDSDEFEELEKLGNILEELKGGGGDEQWKGDWYPITLINSDYFTEYTKELLDDVGYIPKDFPSWISIDWEDTADKCKVDYTTIDIDDETYYYR
jgi:hypothetical protein